MKKQVIAILVFTLLLLEGAVCLLSEQENTQRENTTNELGVTDLQLPSTPPTPCGGGDVGGNGGGLPG